MAFRTGFQLGGTAGPLEADVPRGRIRGGRGPARKGSGPVAPETA